MSNQQNLQNKAGQAADDASKIASNAANEASAQANSLFQEGTKLASDTIAYAQQTAQSILGGAKKQGGEAQDAAGKAGQDAADIANSAAKEGQQQAQQAQHTLSDLTEQARQFVGHALQNANEYIKPQESADQAQGALNNVRSTASHYVDQAADIIAGAQKDAQNAAQDAQKTASNVASDVQKNASQSVDQAKGAVKDATNYDAMKGVLASLRRTSKQSEMHLENSESEWEDDAEEQGKKKDERKTALHLHLYDVSHPGVQAFLRCMDAHPHLLQESLDTVNALLYDSIRHTVKRQSIPRSITFKIRSMGGVAHTTGKILDDEHKEIHFSAEYIDSVAKRETQTIHEQMASMLKPTPTGTAAPPSQTTVVGASKEGTPKANNAEAEVRGVLVHEIVHAVQYTGKGSCPGGLIEGIADWVRLKAGLAPPHWAPHRGGAQKDGKDKLRWDAGYATTAFFLVWLEERLKVPDLIPLLNQKLATRQWSDGEALSRAARQTVDVEQLWKEYCHRGSASG